MAVLIRPEAEQDRAAIWNVNQAAFESDAEANLVDALRGGGFAEVSLVAEAWNLPESFWEQQPDIPPDLPADEEEQLCDAWDKVDQEHYWNPAIMNGAIPICHIGCALRQWLVVNGEQKGFLWNDYRADRQGVLPVLDESGHQPSRVRCADLFGPARNDSTRRCMPCSVTVHGPTENSTRGTS